MNVSAIGIVICRVGAVLLFVQTAKSFQFVGPSIIDFDGRLGAGFILFLLMTALPAIGGLALWFFAEKICSVKIDSPDIKIHSSLRAHDFVEIGTLLIGLYALLYGIIGALHSETIIWTQLSQFQDRPDMLNESSWHIISMRVSYVSEIALGAVLVIGRQKIAELLIKARYAGRGGIRN